MQGPAWLADLAGAGRSWTSKTPRTSISPTIMEPSTRSSSALRLQKEKREKKTFLRLSVTEPGHSLALEDGEFLGGDDGRALDLPGAHQ